MPISQIFQGVTTAPCRDFVATQILQYNPKVVYMPCAGRFGAVQAYINHGGNKDTLKTSDICLYSSLIGYYFDDSHSIEELEITNESAIQPRSDDELEIVAAVMLAIKYGQIKTNSQYSLNIRKEILRNKDQYIDGMKEKIKNVEKILKGCHYDIQDVWDVLNEAAEQEDAAIFVNVPTYKGGYEKMFADSGIRWNEPTIQQFNPNTYKEMIDLLTDAKCKAFVYSQKNLNNIPAGWKTIYAQSYSIDRTDYVVANKPESITFAYDRIKKGDHRLYPIYNDEDITEDTKIEFVKVDEATALYYRDLFVHKLGTTTAEAFFLMLIDGKVNTAMGLSLRDVLTGKTDYVGEVFGISRSSQKYKRLGKLFMFCITSREFKETIMSSYNIGIRDPRGIQTTSLTTYAEGKTDRSVMKLFYREQLEDGTYKVKYRGDFRDETYTDCIKRWLKKWGGISRQEEKNGKTA